MKARHGLRLISIVLLILLVGCGNRVLVKEGVTEEQYLSDRQACDDHAYDTIGHVASWDDNINITRWKRELRAEFYRCMHNKGYMFED